MWKKKGFKGLFKGNYKWSGRRREMRLTSTVKGRKIVREYPSHEGAKEAGWIYIK